MALTIAQQEYLASSQFKPLRSPLNIDRDLRRHRNNLVPRSRSTPPETETAAAAECQHVTGHTRDPARDADVNPTNHNHPTMANTTTTQEVPDLLYHTLLTVINFHADTSGYTRSVYPLGTHTTLPAAKAFAAKALEQLNYSPDDFETYAVKTPENSETWAYGDGVIVYAKAPAGTELLVKIDTTNNDERLPANDDNTPRLPSSSDHLHYVLQTKVDYDQDRSGAAQETQIEGVYVHRKDAVKAAKGMLGDKSEYEQYDERSDSDAEWPFGDDVIVHAVGQYGENYSVAVRTVPGAHKKHAKKT